MSGGRILLGTGSPFVELIRTAREEDVVLIVGTHGRRPVAHMLLGSCAERVVRKAPCPVLTVRQNEHDFIMPWPVRRGHIRDGSSSEQRQPR